MNKITILSLLLIVGMGAEAQHGTINKYTGTYYYFTFPEDKEDSFYAAIPSSDRFVTIRGDTVLNCYKFEIVLGQMGRVAYSKCGSRDTVISNPNALIRLLFGNYRDSRKRIDSLEKLLKDNEGLLNRTLGDQGAAIDPPYPNFSDKPATRFLSGDLILSTDSTGNIWYGRNKGSVVPDRPTYGLPIDSKGTYHDHMPTQLTVKKRHKRHKWVKKSPPATKD